MRKPLGFIIIVASSLVTSCTKWHPGSNPVPLTRHDTAVYIVGVNSKDPYHPIACYWKNGIPNTLDTAYGIAFDVVAKDTDVYISGFIAGTSHRNIPVYWKNGKEITLGDNSTNAVAPAITFSGNDIYVAGNVYNGRAVYWKNGIVRSLDVPDTGGIAHTTGIAVIGSDVYVAGYYSNSLSYSEVPVFWKNNVMTKLGDGVARGRASDVSVNGNDVYIAYYTYQSPERNTAYVWKNGEVIRLPSRVDEPYLNFTERISFDDDSVLVAGSVSTGLVETTFQTGTRYITQAAYWKNYKLNILSISPDGPFIFHSQTGKQALVFQNDVYVAGSNGEAPYGYPTNAYYFKNGIPLKLSDDFYCYANGIVGLAF